MNAVLIMKMIDLNLVVYSINNIALEAEITLTRLIRLVIKIITFSMSVFHVIKLLKRPEFL